MMVSSRIMKMTSGLNRPSATGGIVRMMVLSSADIIDKLYLKAKWKSLLQFLMLSELKFGTLTRAPYSRKNMTKNQLYMTTNDTDRAIMVFS